MPQVMVADESDIVRKVAKRILTALDLEVFDTASANEAIARAFKELPEFVILDAKMDGAADIITSIRSLPGGELTRIFYCVVEADLKTLMTGRRIGADDILLKPFDREALHEKFAAQASAA